MANDMIIFGGVQLNKDEVKTYTSFQDKEGKNHYNVVFQNGTEVCYQESSNGSIHTKHGKLYDGFWHASDKKQRQDYNQTFVYGVMGLELTGTSAVDEIYVDKSSIIKIDVSNDNGFDLVDIHDSKGLLDRGFDDELHSRLRAGCGDIYVDADDQVYVKNSKFINKFKK